MSTTSAGDVSADIKLLRSFKIMGSDGIPSFIIKGCAKIFVLLFVYIFNIILTTHIFTSLSKKLVVIAILKKRQQFRCQ